MATSDLPYVQGDGVRVRADPVIVINRGDWADQSGDTGPANTPKSLFSAAARNDVGDKVDFSQLSRFVCHVGTTGTIWINFLGGDAVANTPGSMPIGKYQSLEIPTDAEVSICGDEANIPYTAGVC